ncbi:beta-ketoacyl synthase N-terminal-like domain-containing protein [Christiangramia crocea]|uniref:Beta-ketoacyl synthase chain length factor n=1 Tax=Christiangramia crocea TaxID=2904124 RepID=A0A9X2A6F6_9FLAO|nr:beta-ketoacyl synthase N-terminal-like domain-containing protein [Gramella crocea]MCG9972299.1 beta-ketoacyl synthase chain length factor [Gramella crocea]
MSRIYINGIASISPQSEDIFETEPLKEYQDNIIPALNQDYKSMINPMLLRRMSAAVKMGLFSSKKALLDAKIDIPDSILVGTGQGCLKDTENFMVSMLNSEEGLLRPTSFIQSTHNTVGGQIALDLKCTGYNMTYTQNSASFESALLDSILQFKSETEIQNVLVGGVDETSPAFTGFQKLDGQLKQEPVRNTDLLASKTSGSIFSETSSFFILGSEESENSYAELVDVEIINSTEVQNIGKRTEQFLQTNNLSSSDIDVVILGNNGDSRYDSYYHELREKLFAGKVQLAFKHLVGENNSVSAYAFWLASKIMKEKRIPDFIKLNDLNCKEPRKILIYNQYLGKNHGLILLKNLDL